MGGHQNLSSELNALVERGQDNTLTLDLRTVSPGDKIKVTLGENHDVYTFTIIEPAKENLRGVDDSASAWLPGQEWSSSCKDKKVKVLIGCACTYNPGAPMMMTMIHLGHLSVGRNFAIWKYGTDSCVIFMKLVDKIDVIKAKAKKKPAKR